MGMEDLYEPDLAGLFAIQIYCARAQTALFDPRIFANLHESFADIRVIRGSVFPQFVAVDSIMYGSMKSAKP